MDSRCYRIGWNMAADDSQPLPAHRLTVLASDVAKQEYPEASDQELYYHGNRCINGYEDQFARRQTTRPGYTPVPWSPGLSQKNGGILAGLQRAHNRIVVDGTLCAQCWEMGVDRMSERCEEHLHRCAGCKRMVKKIWRHEEADGTGKMLCSECIDE